MIMANKQNISVTDAAASLVCPKCLLKFISPISLMEHFVASHQSQTSLDKTPIKVFDLNNQVIMDFERLVYSYSKQTQKLEMKVQLLSNKTSNLEHFISFILSSHPDIADLSEVDDNIRNSLTTFLEKQNELNSKKQLEFDQLKQERDESIEQVKQLKEQTVRNQASMNDIGIMASQNLDLEQLHGENTANVSVEVENNVEIDNIKSDLAISEKCCLSIIQKISELHSKVSANLGNSDSEEHNFKDSQKNELDTKNLIKENKAETRASLTKLFDVLTSRLDDLGDGYCALVTARSECEAEKSSLTSKLDAASVEYQTLLDQYLMLQDKCSHMESALSSCHHELDCLQQIVIDLGRQNQFLQISRDRITSLQWIDDSSVKQCTNCRCEFSLSNRKHHCRRCGEIFCNACSSKRAPTPASKAPLRVCDTCYAGYVADQ